MKQEYLQHMQTLRAGDDRADDSRTDDSRANDGQAYRQVVAATPAGGTGTGPGPGTGSPLNGRNGRVPKVIGPDGKAISIADLPPADTKRWVIRRKAEVVAAVRGGLISLEEACQRYTLSVEEFLSWQRAIESFGLSGLRTTRLQRYRAGSKEKEG